MHVPAHGVVGGEDEGYQAGYLESVGEDGVADLGRELREEEKGVGSHGRWLL